MNEYRSRDTVRQNRRRRRRRRKRKGNIGKKKDREGDERREMGRLEGRRVE